MPPMTDDVPVIERDPPGESFGETDDDDNRDEMVNREKHVRPPVAPGPPDHAEGDVSEGCLNGFV